MTWLSDDTLARLRAATSAPDLSGTRYVLVGEVGRGGMSTVYLAEDPTLRRRVALKVLDVPDERGDLAERLTREARVLARLEHPGIAPVHDVGHLPDGRVFYAMKYVAGPRLDAYGASSATLPERLRLFQRIGEAVAFAHDRGVLHRDLKPENVMVGPFGEVLVMDWGLAKVLDVPEARASADPSPTGETIHTSHGTVLGTPGYMAPEQARGDVDHLDARSDIYALGAVLSFLIAGRTPRTGVPKPLLAVCAKAFGAEEMFRMPGPGDSVMHAEMRIGDSVMMLGDESPERGASSPQTIGGSAVSLFLYVNDVDASFARATKAGCTVQMPPTDMFWGDRYAKLQDPYGHLWGMATHKEDVSPEEIARRAARA